VSAGVSDGSQGLTVGAGIGQGSCTGLRVGATTVGCAPEPAPEPGVRIETGGSALPTVGVQLP
jgi:hypothetical protein